MHGDVAHYCELRIGFLQRVESAITRMLQEAIVMRVAMRDRRGRNFVETDDKACRRFQFVSRAICIDKRVQRLLSELFHAHALTLVMYRLVVGPQQTRARFVPHLTTKTPRLNCFHGTEILLYSQHHSSNSLCTSFCSYSLL